jgi:hypothetical protein
MVKVMFMNGPLRGKVLDVLESTAKRGTLRVVHQIYWKQPTSEYLLKLDRVRGWIAWHT